MARSAEELMLLTRAALLEEAAQLNVANAFQMTKRNLTEAIMTAESLEDLAEDSPEAEDSVSPETAKRAANALDDIRMAFRAGSKKAVVTESDEAVQRLAEQQLTPEERGRVVWGGSATKKVVG